jgi:hypothetical protein
MYILINQGPSQGGVSFGFSSCPAEHPGRSILFSCQGRANFFFVLSCLPCRASGAGQGEKIYPVTASLINPQLTDLKSDSIAESAIEIYTFALRDLFVIITIRLPRCFEANSYISDIDQSESVSFMQYDNAQDFCIDFRKIY